MQQINFILCIICSKNSKHDGLGKRRTIDSSNRFLFEGTVTLLRVRIFTKKFSLFSVKNYSYELLALGRCSQRTYRDRKRKTCGSTCRQRRARAPPSHILRGRCCKSPHRGSRACVSCPACVALRKTRLSAQQKSRNTSNEGMIGKIGALNEGLALSKYFLSISCLFVNSVLLKVCVAEE